MNGAAEAGHHELLPGRSSVVWSIWSIPFIIALSISLGCLLASVFVAPVLPTAQHNLLTASVAWMVFLSASGAVPLVLISKWKGFKERAAGYTTVFADNLNFDQVSPLDGTIIRRAGAPFLAGDRFVEAKMMLRSARRFRRQP